jgi:23S rRNA pseudouridine2605 synthase
VTERLQKVLAHAGLASRRKCEIIIAQGRVTVNGERITSMGYLVDPGRDEIRVDGRIVSAPSSPEYWKLYKPVGVVSTAQDDRGRTTVLDLVPSQRRLYPVGRLDLDSEGLVLLTDDGEAAQLLMHPSYEHPKEYRVLVEGTLSREVIAKLSAGVSLEDGAAAADSVRVGPTEDGKQWLAIALHQGRKRQVRRMLEAVGLKVARLVRTKLGPLVLGDLAPGEAVELDENEVGALEALKRGRSA